MPPASYDSTLTIRDDGVPVSNTQAQGVVCFIGGSSSGSAGSLYSYSGQSAGEAIDDLGKGPLVTAITEHIPRSGRKVYGYKATTSNAGVSSSITKTGSGPDPTLSGAPNDMYTNIIEIQVGGIVGTSTFKYSLDGGDNWSPEIATAATYLLPSGVTVTFTAGTYVADTTYEWTDAAPYMSTTNVTNAIDDIIESGIQIEAIHVCGQAADATGAETMATAIGTKIDAAHSYHKYWRASMELPAVAASALITGFSDFTYRWLSCFGGFCELIQQKDGLIQKRNSALVLVPRVVRNPLSIQPIRTPDDSNIDPVSGIKELVPEGAAASTGYHDENATPGFDAARIACLRKFDGIPGIYPSHVPMMSLPTSPIQTVPDARVILAAATAYYAWSTSLYGRKLKRVATTGFIWPTVADSLDTDAEATLKIAVGADCDGLRVRVRREENLAEDPTLRASVSVLKNGYVFEIESDLGLASTLPAE